MTPEIAALIENKPFDRGGMREAGALLPANDAELHEWILQAVAQGNNTLLLHLYAAAALAGRTLNASLLRLTIAFRLPPWEVAWIAYHMEGNVTGELLRALEETVPANLTYALSLFVATAWWIKHHPGEEPPRRILRYAHSQCERENLDARDIAVLTALATLLGPAAEKDLAAVRKKDRSFRVPDQRGVRKIYDLIDGPFEDRLHEKLPLSTPSTQPIRRKEEPAPNDKCPCGSGRKYKKCCGSRVVHDGEPAAPPLRETAPAPAADPHLGLSTRRLQAMKPADLLRLDITRMALGLQRFYIVALCCAKQHARLIQVFDQLGKADHLEDAWNHTWEVATDQWRPDLARKLMEVFPDAEEKLGVKANAGIRLLLVGDDPARFLQELESSIEAVLRSGDNVEQQKLTWAVLESPYPGLGILLARSALPTVEEKYVDGLYDGILEARAKLDLSAEDEFDDWMNQKALRQALEHQTATVQTAQDKLARIATEKRRAIDDRARWEREANLLKKRDRERESAASAPAPPDEELQQKLREAKAKAEHAQALARDNGEAELKARRELQKVTREMEELKAAGNGAADSAEEEEDEGREDYQVTDRQPPRPIAFPTDFRLTPRELQAAHRARGAEPARLARRRPSRNLKPSSLSRASSKHASRVVTGFSSARSLTASESSTSSTARTWTKRSSASKPPACPPCPASSKARNRPGPRAVPVTLYPSRCSRRPVGDAGLGARIGSRARSPRFAQRSGYSAVRRFPFRSVARFQPPKKDASRLAPFSI